MNIKYVKCTVKANYYESHELLIDDQPFHYSITFGKNITQLYSRTLQPFWQVPCILQMDEKEPAITIHNFFKLLLVT
jgi:hypothetical protein